MDITDNKEVHSEPDTEIEDVPEPPLIKSPKKKVKVRKANPWVSFVKKISVERGISYKEALSIAKPLYHN